MARVDDAIAARRQPGLNGGAAVPFTNNVGERAARMPKVKQKISGCLRTLAGAEHFCVIRSCLDTLRKQGHGMLTVLQHAFAGYPIELRTWLLINHIFKSGPIYEAAAKR